MYGSSLSIRIFSMTFLLGIVLTLSGCGYRIVKHAPEALVSEPKTSYLLSADTREVTAAQLVSDCVDTTVKYEGLREWAK